MKAVKFKKIIEAGFYDANELVEQFINSGTRIVDTPETIIISLSFKQAQYLKRLYSGGERYYIDGNRIYHWKIQKGVKGGDQLVVYYVQSKEDYQQGIEPIRKKFKKINGQGELPLGD